MRVFGIDPGTTRVGFACVDVHDRRMTLVDCGIVNAESQNSLGARLISIRKDIQSLLSEHKPEIISMEQLYFSKNVKTALSVAHARGVILEVISQLNCEIREPTPTNIKQMLLGNGRASKKQIQVEVSRIFGLDTIIQPDDAADAVSICISTIREKHLA